MPKRPKNGQKSLKEANPLMLKAHAVNSKRKRGTALPIKEIEAPKDLKEYLNRYGKVPLVQELFQEKFLKGQIPKSLEDSAHDRSCADELRRLFHRLVEKEGIETVRHLRRTMVSQFAQV